MNRKKTLAILLALCMVAAILCLERCAFSPQTELIFCSQQDCIHPDVLEDFTEETGIRVEYTLLDSSDTLSRQAACDVLLADTETLSLLSAQGYLMSLDTDLLPEHTGIDPVFYTMPFIRTSEQALPAFWSTMGLIYDPTMTDLRVTGWSDLFSDALSGRVVMPEQGRESFASALAALGKDVNSALPEDITSAYHYLTQQGPLVLSYSSQEEFSQLLASHPDLVAPCYGADAVRLMASEEANISFVIPSEGSWQKLLSYAMPAGVQSEENAHLLMDFLTRPENMARSAAYSGYSVVSPAAYELLDRNWQINPLAYPAGRDWAAYPLLDSQSGQLQAECQSQWLTLLEEWDRHHPAS